jgi:hypothetical protein
MDIRLNQDGVLNLVCAAFLAIAIGFSAFGGSARGCAAPRLEQGEIGKPNPCEVAEPGKSGQGRPGMRFLSD